MKRSLTIQDISCIGKCSLTVALPVISSFGIETAVIPTAILSTHTAFNNFTFLDLTDEIKKITSRWEEEKFSFDSIYTGYLGSIRQIKIIEEIFQTFKTENNFILVDPVMADNGKLYSGFDQNFANEMASLCRLADVIVPNLTEAAFMLNEPYIESGYDENYVKNTLKKLCDLGVKTAVLTGVSPIEKENQIGVYAFDSRKNEFFSYYREKLPRSFHGTGDVFASAFCGALTKYGNLNLSLKTAVDFTVESIKKTLENKNRNWYGVDFESALSLIHNVK